MLEFFRFELHQQLRSRLLWLITVVFALSAMAIAGSVAMVLLGAEGDINRNAPVVIAKFLGLCTLFGMLFTAMSINSALLRDFECGSSDLIFACPIKRRDYLFGRILAVLVVCFSIYVAIGIGIFLAALLPNADSDKFGQISFKTYSWIYTTIVVPNLVVTTALLSMLAALTRSILWVYVGVLALYIFHFIGKMLMNDLDNVWIATLSDPLGLRAFEQTIIYWSASDRNSMLPDFSGYFLANRILWGAIAIAMLVASVSLFKAERCDTRRRLRSRSIEASADERVGMKSQEKSRDIPFQAMRIIPIFGAATTFSQVCQMLKSDVVWVVRGVPFFVMLSFALANFVSAAHYQEMRYATPLLPSTSKMIGALESSYAYFLIIVVMFYAGELFGKERAARMNEVADSMPVPTWVPVAAKFGALIVVVLFFQTIGSIAAVAIQMSRDYAEYELWLYVKALMINSVSYILMAGLALCFHIFTNKKFAGYAAIIFLLMAEYLLVMLGFSQRIYLYPLAPNAPYSDMNGYGHFLTGRFSFQAYWALLLGALLLLSVAFLVRGENDGFRKRCAVARVRLRGYLGGSFLAMTSAFVAAGVYLYWNTNFINSNLSKDEINDISSRYEKKYKKYESLAQPRIVAVDIDMDLRPEKNSFSANGTYRIRNHHPNAVVDLHVVNGYLESFDVLGSDLIEHDNDVGYHIYRLKRPLMPGEERDLKFRIEFSPKGIKENLEGIDFRVVENGTFLDSSVFPMFGYARDAEIVDDSERAKRSLGKARRAPNLDDQIARANNYLSGDADRIDLKANICTAPDQIALATGYLQREFMRNGRRCFSYATDRQILNYYAFVSGRFQVEKAKHNDIEIEVFHDKKHSINVRKMIDAVKKSLAYYEENFSKYQNRHLRIVEVPGYHDHAEAFSGIISFSENLGFIADLRSEETIDYVFYVTAHEVAHQWWAHQVVGADTQGAMMLSESLSQYAALMVMEKEYGQEKVRKFLKYERASYLMERFFETIEESPLYRNEGQRYLAYGKGALAFYRLRDQIGEDNLNRALKKFLQAKSYQMPPYTTSAELLDFIRAEAGPEHETFIEDMFEKVTFYDIRIETAKAKKRTDGKFEVELDLRAAKRYTVGKGKYEAGVIDDWIEVGVFARGMSGKGGGEKMLYLKRHRITTESQKLRVVVDAEPYEAGFDPYNKLIDRVDSDNRKRISI